MKKLNKNSHYLLAILLLITSITLVIAAEQTDPDADQEPDKPTPENNQKEPARSSPNITFTPTEEISEDLPVSFPADI